MADLVCHFIMPGRTACGAAPGLASDRWSVVTCPACLAKSPPGVIAERLTSRGRGKSVADVTYARTPLEDQVGKLCACARCEADGQHEPMCSVHAYDADDKPGACDCFRKTT